jgi:hypothetical protein
MRWKSCSRGRLRPTPITRGAHAEWLLDGLGFKQVAMALLSLCSTRTSQVVQGHLRLYTRIHHRQASFLTNFSLSCSDGKCDSPTLGPRSPMNPYTTTE